MSAATLVEVFLGVLVLLGIGFAVTTALPVADADADEPPFPLSDAPVTGEALRAVRFPLAFRGYRMAEVDGVLDRVADALAERDAEIARLSNPPAENPPAGTPPAGPPPAGTPDYDWHDDGSAGDTGA